MECASSRACDRVSVDMNVDCLDEKAVMTYVACLCDALHRDPASAADVHRQEVFRCLVRFGFLSFYFVPGEVQSTTMSMSVCPSARISQKHMSKLHLIFSVCCL